jgi:hypothetical protein
MVPTTTRMTPMNKIAVRTPILITSLEMVAILAENSIEKLNCR